jgi:hypothetical protein
VEVTVEPVNDRPTITEIDDQATDEDVPIGPLGFVIGDLETGVEDLILSWISSNQTLIPEDSIVLDGTGPFRNITVYPALDQSGSATITITADDGEVTTSEEFVVTVNPVNDAPVIIGGDKPLSVVMSEDGWPDPWEAPELSATDVESGDALTWSLSVLPSNGVAEVSGTGSSPELFTYSPEPNFYGKDSFTVEVSDGDAATSIQVDVTVIMVNDPPVITGQNPLSMAENTELTITANDLIIEDPDNIYPDDFAVTVYDGENYSHVGATIRPATDFVGTLTVPVSVEDGTGVIVLEWDANTEPDLVGYKLYYNIGETGGGDPGSYNGTGLVYVGEPYDGQDVDSGFVIYKSDLPDPGANSVICQLSGFVPGEIYYFVVTAVDDEGFESDPSWEIAVYLLTVSNTFDLTVEVLRDVDGDAVPDVDDPDDDNDGMPDTWELANDLEPEVADAADDPDHDGSTNLEEYNDGTDPWMTDTDGDGIGDGTERDMGTDPLDPEDTPDIELRTSMLRVTDVTTRAFSVVWIANREASCYVNIYTEPYPDPNHLIKEGLTITDESADHPPARENGVMKVTVSPLTKSTTYYFQIVTESGGEVLVEPAVGPLDTVVVTEEETLVFIDGGNDLLVHKILQSDGVTPASGALLIAELEEVGSYPITGWVGEGTPSAELAYVDLNNIYSAETHKSLDLQGGESITLLSIGGTLGFRRLNGTVPEEVGEKMKPLSPEPSDDQCTLDTEGPIIDEEQLVPAPDKPTNDETPLISAKYSDEYSEVEPGTLIMMVDGLPAEGVAAGSEGVEYTPTDPLSEGVHEVVLSVSDEWGYPSQPVTWSFEVDLTPPVVSITEPVAGDYLYPPVQTVRWSVDDAPADLSSIRIYVNGVPIEPDPNPGDTEADVTLLPGEDGINIIQVSATDLAGNTGSDSIQVILDDDTDGDGIGDEYDLDDDNDGMPDDWEEFYGLGSKNQSDAAWDKDEDGYANLTEYRTGTDPGDPGDFPSLAFEVKYTTVTDVTPEGFSVIWQSSEPSTCSLVVYDEAGAPLENVEIEPESAFHYPAEVNGVMKVRVSELEPDTTYYFQTVTTSNDLPLFSPAFTPPETPDDAELRKVKTEKTGEVSVGDYRTQQMIYDENENPADGALLVGSVEGGHYPVTAWVGEDVPSPWAQLDFNRVYGEEILGGEELTLWAFGGQLGHYVNVQEIPSPPPLGETDTALPDACYLSTQTGFSLDLNIDLNIVGIPFVPPSGYDSYDLLLDLTNEAGGDARLIQSIRRCNGENTWETTSWFGGQPGGIKFPIKAGEAYLVYMNEYVNGVWFEGIPHGAAVHLFTELNLVSLPATDVPVEFKSYEMLDSLGGETEVSSLRRYDDIWGWQTASWFLGVPSGKNFDTTMGEGYLIYMKEDKANWRAY